MHDLTFALRQLRKSPGFTFVAILTLALGLVQTSRFFPSLIQCFSAPFGFSKPDRLVWISSQLPTNPRAPFSLPEFCDYRDQNTLFDGLAAVGTYDRDLVDSGKPERVQGLRLSANLQLLGVRPFRGRAFVSRRAERRADRDDQLWVMVATIREGRCCRSEREFKRRTTHNYWRIATGFRSSQF